MTGTKHRAAPESKLRSESILFRITEVEKKSFTPD